MQSAGCRRSACTSWAEAEWSLILATLVYVLAATLSWQIPRVEREDVGPETQLEKEELHAPSIFLAGSAMGLLRGAVGFLTFFLAFGLRDNGEPAWVFGAMLVAAGVGRELHRQRRRAAAAQDHA